MVCIWTSKSFLITVQERFKDNVNDYCQIFPSNCKCFLEAEEKGEHCYTPLDRTDEYCNFFNLTLASQASRKES